MTQNSSSVPTPAPAKLSHWARLLCCFQIQEVQGITQEELLITSLKQEPRNAHNGVANFLGSIFIHHISTYRGSLPYVNFISQGQLQLQLSLHYCKFLYCDFIPQIFTLCKFWAIYFIGAIFGQKIAQDLYESNFSNEINSLKVWLMQLFPRPISRIKSVL